VPVPGKVDSGKGIQGDQDGRHSGKGHAKTRCRRNGCYPLWPWKVSNVSASTWSPSKSQGEERCNAIEWERNICYRDGGLRNSRPDGPALRHIGTTSPFSASAESRGRGFTMLVLKSDEEILQRHQIPPRRMMLLMLRIEWEEWRSRREQREW